MKALSIFLHGCLNWQMPVRNSYAFSAVRILMMLDQTRPIKPYAFPYRLPPDDAAAVSQFPLVARHFLLQTTPLAPGGGAKSSSVLLPPFNEVT